MEDDRVERDRQRFKQIERIYLAKDLGRIAYRARKLRKQVARAQMPTYCREMAKIALYRLDNIEEHVRTSRPGAQGEE